MGLLGMDVFQDEPSVWGFGFCWQHVEDSRQLVLRGHHLAGGSGPFRHHPLAVGEKGRSGSTSKQRKKEGEKCWEEDGERECGDNMDEGITNARDDEAEEKVFSHKISSEFDLLSNLGGLLKAAT